MVIHSQRRDLNGFYSSLHLHHSQLPSDDQVVGGRAKSLRSLAAQERRHRRRRQQVYFDLGRT
jgi:hypothetical protein